MGCSLRWGSAGPCRWDWHTSSGERGAWPHVAVQHHNYFIVLSCFLSITLPSHPALIVHCRMGPSTEMRGPPPAPNDNAIDGENALERG